ncbi:flagellar basal body-associated FliL family protein [Campylobacter sp. 19-13652]|uniref:flagellar basal body-associated FliL family protein n=1 Tax=Campylobacter sp. 19-13652 TaxID=2840180 RepID=UPI001C745F99|nr:hypothetical protein [Campylobacter sp. 19-13652]BCX79345.1 hypothetical protein LBC_08070 [Campylobacter sp. 19-13652]
MIRTILLAMVAFMAAGADILQIKEFSTDVYSKMAANATKKVSLSLEVIGRDMGDNEAYVLDALNVIIGSFYVEDLLTSRGKERLKSEFIKYAAKKHSIDIDTVLILGLRVVEDLSLERVLAAIKERNLCSNNDGAHKDNKPNANEIIISPKNLNQKPIDLNSIKEFGKDFGEE